MRKSKNIGLVMCLAFLLMGETKIASGASPKTSIPSDTIARNIFLGQTYPSGNTYLKAFNDELGDLPETEWPAKIIFYGFASHDAAARFHFGNFKRVLKDSIKNGVTQSIYLPGLEHMSNEHAICANGAVYTKNSNYRYVGPDFFYAGSGYCDPNQGIAAYSSTEKDNRSFRVVAFSPTLAVEDIKLSDGTEGRPLVPGEADEINRKKKAGASTLNDCTTIPAFLSEAILIMTFSIGDSANTARVSSYDDPGCMGHLETIYVLDVFDDGHFQKRYELHQIKGSV